MASRFRRKIIYMEWRNKADFNLWWWRVVFRTSFIPREIRRLWGGLDSVSKTGSLMWTLNELNGEIPENTLILKFYIIYKTSRLYTYEIGTWGSTEFVRIESDAVVQLISIQRKLLIEILCNYQNAIVQKQLTCTLEMRQMTQRASCKI